MLQENIKNINGAQSNERILVFQINEDNIDLWRTVIKRAG